MTEDELDEIDARCPEAYCEIHGERHRTCSDMEPQHVEDRRELIAEVRRLRRALIQVLPLAERYAEAANSDSHSITCGLAREVLEDWDGEVPT